MVAVVACDMNPSAIRLLGWLCLDGFAWMTLKDATHKKGRARLWVVRAAIGCGGNRNNELSSQATGTDAMLNRVIMSTLNLFCACTCFVWIAQTGSDKLTKTSK